VEKLGKLCREKNTDGEREREKERKKEREKRTRVTGIVYWCVGMNPDERKLANEMAPRHGRGWALQSCAWREGGYGMNMMWFCFQDSLCFLPIN